MRRRRRWRRATCARRNLRRGSFTYRRPASQPALKGRQIRTARERHPLPARCLSRWSFRGAKAEPMSRQARSRMVQAAGSPGLAPTTEKDLRCPSLAELGRRMDREHRNSPSACRHRCRRRPQTWPRLTELTQMYTRASYIEASMLSCLKQTRSPPHLRDLRELGHSTCRTL